MRGREKVFVSVGALAVVGACLSTVVMKQAHDPAELFAHGGATDFVGRKPRASAFHSFHARTFPTRGEQQVNAAIDMVGTSASDLSLESLSESNNHNMVMHSQLSKCFHLAKSFQGTKSGQRKVTAARRLGLRDAYTLRSSRARTAATARLKESTTSTRKRQCRRSRPFWAMLRGTRKGKMLTT